jgi:D-proline reductase (dithiol) PrdB
MSLWSELSIDPEELDRRYRDWVARVEETHHGANHRVNPSAAFTPLSRPLEECTVALVSTAGVHLEDQPPFDTESIGGDPSYRTIPGDADPRRLRFSHTHYDTSSAQLDPNVVFPIDRLTELATAGRIGQVAPFHIGMMGFNPDPTQVAERTAPEVAGLLSDAGTDVAILVPG